MNFDEDFPQEGAVKFKVGEREFEYLPLTTGIELDNVEELGDFKRGAEFKLSRVVSVPYTKDQIRKKTGLDREYAQLSKDEKIVFWRTLRPSMTTKVLEEISKIERGESEDLKNSSSP